VDRLTADGPNRGFAWDSELLGFGAIAYPTGRKSYVIQYRTAGGRSRRLALGAHGVLTADQARRLAMEKLGAVRMGKDPADERRALRDAPTVVELAERYIEEHLPKKKPRSAREDRRILIRYVLPVLGNRRVADVTSAELGKLHASLRRTPIMANRVLALLGTLFTLAERWEWRSQGSNPARAVEWFRETRRERFLADTELARLGDALAALEAEDIVRPTAAAALRLLLLTGARRGEVLRLRWREVDLERGYLRLEDSKTGAKVIPLSQQARALIGSLARDGEWVFPSPHVDGASLRDLRKPWRRVLERAGLSRLRLHDLRHTHASVAAAAGISLQAIGSILGHRSTSTTAKYAHLVADPVRVAADRVGDRLSAALEGRTQESAVPLRHLEGAR
jgi:integrase